MKRLCVFLLVCGSAFAQFGAYVGPVSRKLSEDEFNLLEAIQAKTQSLKAYKRTKDLIPFFEVGFKPLSSARPLVVGGSLNVPGTTTDLGSVDLPYSPFYPVIAPLSNNYPAAAPHPRMIFQDGLGDSIIAMDLTTLTVAGKVVVPTTSGPFGLRPAASSSAAFRAATEAWVTNGGLQVTVVDFTSQSVITNISTPSVPTPSTAVGIVFTPDGTTAMEAVRLPAPDAAGNGGALLVFDAVNRKVTSTFPLKNGPASVLIAPDGATVYVLSVSGQITYYDVLSGTADLTLSTYPPGQNSGFPGSGGVAYMHPDGTRIFWNVGVNLISFDINSRQAASFSSGLPTTVGRTFTLSPDGEQAFFSNPLGDVGVLSTRSGAILASYNTGSATSAFAGPPVAP